MYLSPTYHDLTSALFYALGYGVGIATFAAMARRRKLFTTGVWNVAWVGLIGGLLGANIAQWIASGTPLGTPAGKSVIGGVIGGYLSVFLYKKYIGLKRPLGDLFAVALCAGEAVGRLGCYYGGCCYGKPWTGRWAVFQHGTLRYPTQLSLSLAALVTLLILFFLEKKKTLPENGIFYLQGILFGSFRFVIEFYRDGTMPFLLSLNIAQWTCLGFIVYFSIALTRLVKNHATRENPLPQLP